MKKIVALCLVMVLGFASGCSAISHAPAVSQSNQGGEYLTVVNKTSMFMGIIMSNRNVVVRCNQKTNECATLNLWTKDGYRIF